MIRLTKRNFFRGSIVAAAFAVLPLLSTNDCKIPSVSELRTSAVCRLSDGSIRFKPLRCDPDRRKLQNGDKILVEGPNGPVHARVVRKDNEDKTIITLLDKKESLGTLEVSACLD